MTDFKQLLNWKLDPGSHEFPNADGLTCVNEAAIIAAGLPYREIDDFKKLPKGFCPVISAFAAEINDYGDDAARQALLPFVLRLSQARGKNGVWRERQDFIIAQWISRVLPPLLEHIGAHAEAASCRGRQSLEKARACAHRAGKRVEAMLNADDGAKVARSRTLHYVMISCLQAARARDICKDRISADDLALTYVGMVAVKTVGGEIGFWPEAIKILDEALHIGARKAPLDLEEAGDRLAAKREQSQGLGIVQIRQHELPELELG